MAADERLICRSEELREGAAGVRFSVPAPGGAELQAFAVRHLGAVCAFVNRCPHMGTELDWQPGEFFDVAGLYLVCATHGALFQPATGFCVAGPCSGASLERLRTREHNGRVLLLEAAAPATPDETP